MAGAFEKNRKTEKQKNSIKVEGSLQIRDVNAAQNLKYVVSWLACFACLACLDCFADEDGDEDDEEGKRGLVGGGGDGGGEIS